ncbi:hypothetical protein [Brevibacterium aurantiacum]|uniref:Uncharacterized protein n=1 Tax=Brevibacterium aurantiacum TaxID=273384 RepID=A0A556C3F9_BREAU|nr:hypothetical protein [Brevibacterium aurantiacum]TSI11987.1 hypothetical protein FO013_21325 [Brevibacterium aurantiacum]
MSSEILVAVFVGVLTAVITGGCGLVGIIWTLRNSDKHRRLEAIRSTHDTAVSACESARALIEHASFWIWELSVERDDNAGSEYSLPTPTEMADALIAEDQKVRAALYRVEMGNADPSIRENAQEVRSIIGHQIERIARILQMSEGTRQLRTLLGEIESMESPLRELENSIVKAFDS